MADYLETYAHHFDLPVALEARVTRLTREGGHFVLEAAGRHYEAAHVIVAMSNYQVPRRPGFARELAPSIRQFDPTTYRNPSQLIEGDVLIVGAANSGAEIAKDLVETRKVILAGRKVDEVPGRYESFINQHVVVHILNRLVFPHILSVKTPIGRRARPSVMRRAVPLIRVKSRDLAAMGVVRRGKVTGARDGFPMLDDGTFVCVSNIIWCIGFANGLDWIELPVRLPDGEPNHEMGVARNVPGLYFVGQHFLASMASAMVHGVNRDARRIAAIVADDLHSLQQSRHGRAAEIVPSGSVRGSEQPQPTKSAGDWPI
jgi:putative flavoprotein involved in K+ transport